MRSPGDESTTSILLPTVTLFLGCAFFTTITLITQRIFRSFSERLDLQVTTISELLWSNDDRPSSPLNLSSFTSILSLLFCWTVFGLVLLYAFICEHYLPFPPNPIPNWDPDQIATWMVLLVGFAFFYGDTTTTRSRPSQVISASDQEDRILQEFKGITFVLYVLSQCYRHDDGAFVPGQLFLAVYVWWTSFRHATFFYETGDFGWTRILQSLWTPCSILLLFGFVVADGKWMSMYFLCFMELIAFLVSYLVFCVGATSLNTNTRWGLRMKCLIAVVVFYFIWDVPNPNWLAGIFGGKLLASNATQWNWYVLSMQYHWFVIFGIVFALNRPITIMWREKLDRQIQRISSLVFARVVVALVLIVAILMVWSWIASTHSTSDPSFSQPATELASVLLILTFIYLRTCTHRIRQRCLRVFEIVGEFAMEAYILQNHVVLCANGRALVALLSPAWPQLNFIVVFLIFLASSRALSFANKSMSGILFGDTRNVAGFAFFLFSSLLLCTGLQLGSLMQGWAVAFMIIICGALLHSIILRLTNEQSTQGSASSSSMRSQAPVVVGALFVCLVGYVYHSQNGRTTADIILLSSACEQAVQQGKWFPVDVCNQEGKSLAYRKHNVLSVATCPATMPSVYAWGWQSTTSPSSCHMTARDPTSLLWGTLAHRNLTFVGDSIVRHLYHATCRQVGHQAAGAYNTSLGKWSDFSRQYMPDTSLDFRWAPFTSQVIPILQHFRRTPAKDRPDVLIVGGGAWDLLYHTRTQANRTALDEEIKRIAQELRSLRKSGQTIVWVVPTMINSWALMTEDKRLYMREDQMIKLRAQYERNGVLQATSFALDGLSFTRDRVNESYDGVHYPLSIYDGGSQILLNALDWLLPPPPQPEAEPSPDFSSLASPQLGLVAVTLLVVCIVTMDSFFGLTYLAAILVPSTTPKSLYDEGIALLSRMDKERPQRSSFLQLRSKSSDHAGDEDQDARDLDGRLVQRTTLEEETLLENEIN